MTTLFELRGHLGTLAATLWNYGATFAVPTLDTYDSGEVGFSLSAELPGSASPKPAVIKLAEIWAPAGHDNFSRSEYEYDFIEHPLDRCRGSTMDRGWTTDRGASRPVCALQQPGDCKCGFTRERGHRRRSRQGCRA